MTVSYNPRIVTDGLVLCLDAANQKSYPGSGTTWTDLSGFGNNGTLVNGPTYSNGTLQLVGVTNQFIIMPVNTLWQMNGSNTVNIWVKPTLSTGWIVNFKKGSELGYEITPTGFTYCGIGATADDNGLSWSYSAAWQMITLVIDRILGKYIAYRNGNQVSISNIVHPAVPITGNLYIGARGDVPDNFYTGAVSACSFYNRALSAAEITQNFNATRGRYGI